MSRMVVGKLAVRHGCRALRSAHLRAATTAITWSRAALGTGRGGGWGTGSSGAGSFVEDDMEGLREELASALEGEHVDAATSAPDDVGFRQPLEKADVGLSSTVPLEKLARPPARFDLMTNSFVYRWQTTAAVARKVSGPMREWAAELKYRTGVHIEVEPTFPERLVDTGSDGYAQADDVDVTVYLFGSDRGVFNCQKLIESAIQQDPVYVRLAVFRRRPDEKGVEWLVLRRINRELRPPDIPPISLKTPGKWTLLYEQYKEAALRTLWEETGITVNAATVFPTAQLRQTLPQYYWRVPVRYFIAEVPYDVKVEGPQVVQNMYMRGWDPRLLRQSPDPIDRAWAQLADPDTGCAWMTSAMLDELQKPLRGDNYMATRYTPPPYSGLQEVVGLGGGPSTAAGAGGSPSVVDATNTTSASPGNCAAGSEVDGTKS